METKNAETDHSPWLTVEEAATRLKLNKRTLQNYLSRGLIRYHTNPVTKTKRLKVEDVDSFLQPVEPGAKASE